MIKNFQFLTSRAEGNKANIELVKLLAKHFNTAQKNISIIRGRKSRKNVVEIRIKNEI